MATVLYQLVQGALVPLDGSTPPPPPPSPSAPTANATATPASGPMPLGVQFSASGSTAVAPATIVSYAWAFGDGGTGTGTAPTHSYQTAGSFTATLTVTDSNGLKATDTVAVTVTQVSSTAKLLNGMFNSCAVPGSGLGDGQSTGGGFTGNGFGVAQFTGIADTYLNPNGTTHSDVMASARTYYQLVSADNNSWNSAGLTQWANIKGDVLGVKAGNHDATIIAFVKSLGINDKLSYWGEAERRAGIDWRVNDPATGAYSPTLTGLAWRDAHRRIYQLTKNPSTASPAGAGRTDVEVAPCHLTYAWRNSATQVVQGTSSQPGGTVSADTWWVGAAYCDAIGADSYFMQGDKGATSMTQNTPHMNWHTWAAAKGKPLVMGEFGVVHTFEHREQVNGVWGPWAYDVIYTDAALQTLLINCYDWFLTHGYVAVYLWNGWHSDFTQDTDSSGRPRQWFRNMNITPTESDTTHVRPSTLRAFNDWMRVHGKVGKRWIG